MKRILSLVMLFALLGGNAHAGFINGGKFISLSKSYGRAISGAPQGKDAGDAAIFLGYVAGVYDLAIHTKTICPPGGEIDLGTAAAIVSAYIAPRTMLSGEPACTLALVALGEAFPCPKETK